MALLHYTHRHPLQSIVNDQEYLCDECETIGIGKRYRCQCHGCDFNLHDYCGTCPRALSSFMHNHSLTRSKAQQNLQGLRICDICNEPVEGIFYTCQGCDFDVHPLCTQLPEGLQHALDKIHPLILESPRMAGFCAVCNDSCNGWRYRCRICRLDIHLDCVLVPIVQNSATRQRGVPFQPQPQFASYYGFGPGYPNFGPGHPNFGPVYQNSGPGLPNYGPGNMYNNGYPQNLVPQNHQARASSSTMGGCRKSMFSLVGQLGFGVLSNMIFGVDVSSLFSG